MVYRVLSILNRIVFGLMTLAFVVCLVYTISAPVVQSGVQQVQQSAEQIASSAAEAMQSELTRQTDEALGGVSAALSQARQAVEGVWATFTAPDGAAS